MTEALQNIRLTHLRRVFRKEKAEIARELDCSFYEYFRPLFEDSWRFDEYSDYCRRLFDRTQARGKNVLDVGCGFGLVSTHFALFGAKQVCGVDLNEKRLNVFSRILSTIKPPMKNAMVKLGNEWTVDFEDDYFDVVLAIDTLAYMKHLSSFLGEVRRVLKKGGVFLISDLNNVLNPFRRWHPYLDLDEFVQLLRSERQGRSEREEFLSKEKFMREQEINPLALKAILKKAGFSAEIISPIKTHVSSGFKGNVASKFYSLVSFFHPLSLVVAPYFNIEAKKQYLLIERFRSS